jgi:hypothetical protein
MAERQYINFKVEELEAIVTINWDDEDALRLVVNELNFRHTGRAARLQRKVEKRILELDERGGESPTELTEIEMLFARVGLHPSAPDFLVDAARKAYRKNYHPDRHASATDDKRKEMEETFKEMDNVFDEIERLRQ